MPLIDYGHERRDDAFRDPLASFVKLIATIEPRKTPRYAGGT